MTAHNQTFYNSTEWPGTIVTSDQSDEKTLPDQQKDIDKDKYNDKYNDKYI